MTNEELINQIRNNNNRAAMQQLYNQNRGLIYRTIKPYIQYSGAETDDLMQTAYFGLNEAVQRFDQNKGNFASYLPHWIRAAIIRSFQDQGKDSTVRIPEFMRERIQSYNQISAEYRKLTGEKAPDAFIRHRLKISAEQLNRLKNTIYQLKSVSLSKELQGTDDMTIADIIPDQRDMISELCDRIDDTTDAQMLWDAVDALDKTESDLIKLRYKDNLTMSQTAAAAGTTVAKTRCAIDRGLGKLKRNRILKQIADERGYYSRELYGGTLASFRYTGDSIIESAVIRRMDGNT